MDKGLIEYIDDHDVIKNGSPKDLWVYNKLKLSKFLGYKCGNRNKTPVFGKEYVVRPQQNPDGMGVGAKIIKLTQENFEETVKEGYFWCEKFEGRHLSYDFEYGINELTVEGVRDSKSPLWKWTRWVKVKDRIELPQFLKPQAQYYRWINFESIGGNIIEVHLRPNKDFLNTTYTEVVPIWSGQEVNPPAGYKFVKAQDYKRIGFYVK